MDKNKAFQDLASAFKKAFPEKSTADSQNEAIQFWNSIKNEDDFPPKFQSKMAELNSKILKKKSTLLSFWSKASTKTKNLGQVTNSSGNNVCGSSSTNDSSTSGKENEPKNDEVERDDKFETPAQDKLKKEINVLRNEIQLLKVKKRADLLSQDDEKILKEKEKILQVKEKSLKVKQDTAERNRKFRENKRKNLEQICLESPDISKKLKLHPRPGRPRVEVDQPELFKAILNICTHGSAADNRRRTETFNCVRTLSELTEVLRTELGFNISRSATYLRLIPRRANSIEGKKHVVTVPVKLAKPQNDSHKHHVDSQFAAATMRNLEEVASTLGPDEVAYISQDDKARVPLGITAAQKQSPLLMNMEYRVRLPDHDWVVAPAHKLIPSVYAGIVIKENGFGTPDAVSYSGPTYIAIRSGKHSSSTAWSHVLDVEKLLDIPEFDVITKDSFGNTKPVVIFNVDGGPDENPRYKKVILSGIHHFIKNNLDALYIACNAPGRSAFNRVERRMAPLSRELSGVILPHEKFGTHLDKNGKTVDKEKEKQNFEFAGQALAEIWSNTIIDNHPVVSEYITPDNSEICESDLVEKTQKWEDAHVRSSQYFTQIVKCTDKNCCSPIRSSLLKVLPNRFFPPPLPIAQGQGGLQISEGKGKYQNLFLTQTLESTIVKELFPLYKTIPYDIMCPSVKNGIKRKICNKCGLYIAAINRLQCHQKLCGSSDITTKIRPVRIAAARQNEFLALIKNYENEEEWEWLEKDSVDDSNSPCSFEKENEIQAQVMTIDDHLQPIWENQ